MNKTSKKLPSKNKMRLLKYGPAIIVIAVFGFVGFRMLTSSSAAEPPRDDVVRQEQLSFGPPHSIINMHEDNIRVAVADSAGCVTEAGTRFNSPQWSVSSNCDIAAGARPVMARTTYTGTTPLYRTKTNAIRFVSNPASIVFTGDPAVWGGPSPVSRLVFANGANGTVYMAVNPNLGGVFSFDPPKAMPALPPGVRAVGTPVTSYTSLYVRGSDNKIYYAAINYTNPATYNLGEWRVLPPVVGTSISSASDISVVLLGGFEYVFARGANNVPMYMVLVGGSINKAWTSLGGAILSSISVGITADAGLEIVARGTDSGIYMNHAPVVNTTTPLAFNGWQAVGGAYPGDPLITYTRGGLMEVIVRCTNNQMCYGIQSSYTTIAPLPWVQFPLLPNGRTAVTP